MANADTLPSALSMILKWQNLKKKKDISLKTEGGKANTKHKNCLKTTSEDAWST